jgi:hypothetical protein
MFNLPSELISSLHHLIQQTKNCFIVTTNVKTFRNNHRQTQVQRSLLLSPTLRYVYKNVTTIINKALDLGSGQACHGYAKNQHLWNLLCPHREDEPWSRGQSKVSKVFNFSLAVKQLMTQLQFYTSIYCKRFKPYIY